MSMQREFAIRSTRNSRRARGSESGEETFEAEADPVNSDASVSDEASGDDDAFEESVEEQLQEMAPGDFRCKQGCAVPVADVACKTHFNLATCAQDATCAVPGSWLTRAGVPVSTKPNSRVRLKGVEAMLLKGSPGFSNKVQPVLLQLEQ